MPTDDVDGEESGAHRHLRAVQHRAGLHRGLTVAGGALPEAVLLAHLPTLPPLTDGAGEALRGEILDAGPLVREALLELGTRQRTVSAALVHRAECALGPFRVSSLAHHHPLRAPEPAGEAFCAENAEGPVSMSSDIQTRVHIGGYRSIKPFGCAPDFACRNSVTPAVRRTSGSA